MARSVLLVLVVGLWVALSGCIERGEGEWPEPEGTEGGDGDSLLVTKAVVEEHGGAPVVDAVIRAKPHALNLTTIYLRTGEDGIARFHLPANETYTLTTRAPGHVIHKSLAETPKNAGEEKEHVIPLIHDHRHIELEATWPGPAHVTVTKTTDGIVEETLWAPQGNLFSQNDTVERAYLVHLDRLEVQLQWTNNLTVYADLGIGIDNAPRDEPRFFHDAEDQQVMGGPQQESVWLGPDEIHHYGLRSGSGLHVGPGTQHLVVAPFDLVTTITLEAWFDIIETRFAPVGGWGLVIVAVMTGVLITRCIRGFDRRQPQADRL